MATESPINPPACLLRLLGTPQIESAQGVLGGGVVQRHRLALLGILAVAPRGLLARDRLLALLWPEASTESARNLLNAAVHAVRRSVGDGVLITQGSGLQLDTALIRIDVLDFETALRHGHNGQAIDLYTGPFLDGLALPGAVEFERWQERERERLERLYHAALEHHAESVAREYGAALAVPWWQRRLACTPTDARTVIRLMQALVAVGDRAGAMRAASIHARLLEEEFDARPDPAVAKLADDIQSGLPDLAVSAAVTPPDPDGLAAPFDDEHRAEAQKTQSQSQTTTSHATKPRGIHESGGDRRRRAARLAYRPSIIALLSAVLIVTGITTFDALRPRPNPTIDPNVVLVVPFRVTASDSALNILREGIVDILSAQLTGEGLPRAVDSRLSINAWQRAVHEQGGDLTTAQSIALAAQFGAGQLLLGELVATTSSMHAAARILSVPDGQVLAEHDESAADNEIDLIRRLIGRLLAERSGEAEPRLRALSESEDAMRAYLAAMQAHRNGRYQEAFERFGQALDHDSEFAIAALRRTESADLTPSAVNILEANLEAWRLQDRLSRRDRAILQTAWVVGPNYPGPSTIAERIAALERAAIINPDRPEAWLRLGSFYLIYGASASVREPLAQAVAALDRAIALDSTFTPALQARLWAALEQYDTASIRWVGLLYKNAQRDAPLAAVHEWLIARALRDSASMRSISKQLYDVPNVTDLLALSARGAVEGFSLAQADSAILRALGIERHPERWTQLSRRLMIIAALRGRSMQAMALSDSLIALGNVEVSTYVIALALADSGYEVAADRAAAMLDAFADSSRSAGPKANALCYAELWRSLRGNTDGASGAAEEIRRVVQDFDPAPFPRVGRMGVCPLLLEVAAGWTGSSMPSAVGLDTLDALMRQGIGLELPGQIANLMVARWREREGDHRSALAAVRRRLGGMQNPHFTLLQPVFLREEGRLAALMGDTITAIRAYRHYLALRDSPDDGPMQREVLRVQAHLATLEQSLSEIERRRLVR